MRAKFVYLLLLTCSFAAATNKDNFIAKLNIWQTIFDKNKLGTICDSILNGIANLQTMGVIGTGLVPVVGGLYITDPLGALSLVSLKGSVDSCLKPYNSDTISIGVTILPGFELAMTKIYKLMKKKVKKMKANNKSTAQIVDQLYYLGTASITQDYLQHILWFIQKNVTAGQWTCAVKYGPKILNLNSFDMTFRPKKWMYPYKK